ncbi:MAG: carbohydrate-binding domain-containing protein [Candidatus Aceula meridiana]|nr:carbohydrate-binding domain-containing protein [Candidatus Aceula meridiana]
MITFLIKLLAADIFFIQAQKYEKKYLFEKAINHYQKAIDLAPLSSEYLGSYGKFLTRISKYNKDKFSILNKAEKLCKDAIQKNPMDSKFWILLGKIQLEQFSETSGPVFLKLAIKYFKQAFKNDPNGEITTEGIAYNLAEFLLPLNKPDFDWALNKIKKTLQVDYPEVEYLYVSVWKSTKNISLLKELAETRWKKQKKIKKSQENAPIDPSLLSKKQWYEKSFEGKNFYSDGNMYWNGTAHQFVEIPGQANAITIQAKGSSAYGIWPYMVVSLNGKEIGADFIQNVEFKNYAYPIAADKETTTKIISVTFTNDGGNKIEDRNLYVGEVTALSTSQ